MDAAEVARASGRIVKLPHVVGVDGPVPSADGRTALLTVRYDVPVTDLKPAEADVLAQVSTGAVQTVSESTDDHTTEADAVEEAWSPVVIRKKVFAAAPMTVDDALYLMELVGHDFYLFIDAETLRPSVVYRRKGWDYGVIGLDDSASPLLADAREAERVLS